MSEAATLALRVAELERLLAGVIRPGTVHEVDPAKQVVRLRFGDDDDGSPFLSPWVPYGQTAGSFKFHNPPSVGQQMMIVSPNGDWRQGAAVPFHWSNQNPSPSQKGDEHVMTFGSVTVTIKGDEVVWSVGSSSIKMTGSNITITSAEIVTDGATRLDNGERPVHYVTGKDSDGDVAVDGADRVFV